MHIFANTSLTSNVECILFELLMLVTIETEEFSDQKCDASFSLKGVSYYVYKRPHADEMIKWLNVSGIRVGIWTHETRRMTLAVLKHAFPLLKLSVSKGRKFIYTRRSCGVYNDILVKDLRRVSKKCLLVDFNDVQIAYNVENNIPHVLLIDATCNLKKIFSFIRFKLKHKNMIRV